MIVSSRIDPRPRRAPLPAIDSSKLVQEAWKLPPQWISSALVFLFVKKTFMHCSAVSAPPPALIIRPPVRLWDVHTSESSASAFFFFFLHLHEIFIFMLFASAAFYLLVTKCDICNPASVCFQVSLLQYLKTNLFYERHWKRWQQKHFFLNKWITGIKYK